MPAPDHLSIFQSADALSHAAAEYIISKAAASIHANGRFSFVLSGGQTPQMMYALLSKSAYKERMDWDRVFIFWGDERCVPLNDEQNNAYQAFTLLLNNVPIPRANIHRIQVDLSPGKAAHEYENQLLQYFGKNPQRFDVILLGLGENGHTASLFPGPTIMDDSQAGIKSVYVETEKRFRISMTAALINQARHLLFLVTGKSKAFILNQVLNAPYEPRLYPAQLIRPVDGTIDWYIDEDAATLLQLK
ncbi:MAG TPA: 6-phosphogluconolactonase [Saprospiraceae bacterium]|nr:6-phosphogluconolactonase [Saprospiraceae bacterium]